MLDLHSPEVRFALDAVRQASLLVRTIQQEMVSPALTKDDRSPVTVADFAAQAVVARRLAAAFPNDPLVGEESAGALRSEAEQAALAQVTGFVSRVFPGASPADILTWIDRGGGEQASRFWTLDPIDGTKGFLRGDQYAIALALIEEGQVVLGVLGCPNLSGGFQPDLGGAGSLVAAQRGQGTWTASLDADLSDPAAFQALHASPAAEPTPARILRSFEAGHTNADQVDQMAARLGITAAPVKMDSQAKYAVLAAGAGEIMVRLLSPKQPDYKEKIWDQAAGSIVIEEAGGTITDLSGKPLDFSTGRMLLNNRGVLATNGLLHAIVLAALQEVGA